MAAELTIQSVEGLSQAFDKLNRSVSGVKSSLGTIKGTNALRELQSVVAGVNGLQAAISTMDRGLGAALGKIVSKLDELPRSLADALGSGAQTVKAAGDKLAKAAEEAAAKAADKAKAVQARADGQFRAALLAANTKRIETQQLADAQFRAALEASEAKTLAAKIAANERQMAVDAAFRKAELDTALKAQAQVDKVWDKAVKDQQARTKLMEANREKQLAADRRFAEARQAIADKAARDAKKLADKAAEAAAQEAKAAAVAADKLAADIARARNNQAISKSTSPAGYQQTGAFSVFAPGTSAHGQVRQLNTELGNTPSAAAAAAKGLRNLGVDTNTTHSAMRGLASGFNLLWLTWGNLVPLLAGAAISNGFVQTIKLGVEVTQTFDTIRVLSEETAASVARLEQQMLTLSKTGPFGLSEIATAMKTLSLAGLDAAQVGSAVRDVLNFAVAGDTSIKQAADTLTSVATAFRYSASEYNVVADVIAKTAAVSKSSVENMSEAFKVASVLNAQYGASLKDVGLGLAALSNLGITGSAAGTALRNMYVDLSGRSKQVVKLMKELDIEIRDMDTGKFPDLVTMMQKLEEGLNRSGSAMQRQINLNKLLSERGAKPVIELLQQLETQVQITGGTVSTELARLREKIDNAAGFSAIAAAEMSLTSANQIKSVFASLQASAYEAFKAVEPLVFEVAQRLKQVFGSQEFKTGLANVITLVGNFTAALVENLDVIVKLAAAFVALKAAMFISGAAQAAAASMEKLAAASLAANVAASAGGIASAGLSVAGLASRATAAVPAIAGLVGIVGNLAKGLGFLLRFISGPVGIALTALAIGWEMVSLWTNKAADANERHAGAKGKALEDALKAETEALKEKNQALLAGITLEELRARKEQSAQEYQFKLDWFKKLTDAREAVTAAERAYNAAAATAKKGGLPGQEAAQSLARLRANLAAAKADKQAIEDAKAGAEQRINILKNQVREEGRVNAVLVEMRRSAEEKLRQDARSVAMQASETAGEDKVGKAGNLMAELEKRYKDEAQAAKEAADREQRMLQDRRQNLLITEGEYQAKSTQLAEQSERDRLDVINRYLPQMIGAYDAARKAALGAKDPEAAKSNLENQWKTMLQQLSTDDQSITGAAFERVTKNANAAAGAIQKLQQEYSAYWEKDAARLAEQSAARQLAADLDMAGESAKTFSAAAATAMQAYTPQISKTASELAALKKEQEAVQIALGTTDFSLMGGTETSGQITDLTNRISFLTTELERLKAKAKETATSAGSLAVIEKYLGKDIGSEAAKGYDKASRALAGFINGVVNLTEAWKEQEAVRKEAEDKRARGMLDAKNPEELAKNEITYRKTIAAVNEKAAQQDIRNYGNIAGAAKTFFKEGSQGYKNLGNIEKAFRIAEFAMATKAVAMKVWEWATKTTVVATGEGTMTATTAAGEAARNLLKIPGVFLAFMGQLGPWGIPAAAAAIAAVGIAYGARKPSGQFEAPNEGKGTTFGDSDAKSKSITNAIEKLADNSDITLQYSSGMLSALKNIEANIGGITNLVLRGNVDSDAASRLGVSGGTKVAAINSAELNLTLAGAMLGGPLGAALGAVVSKIPIVQKITNALFGAKTTVKGSGLSLGDTSLATLAGGGGNLQEYADTNTTKKFLGITYSNKNSTITGAADPVLARQFGLVFKGFYDAIKLAAVPLGQNLDEVTTRLNNFVVKIGKIDLQGLTGEQIQEKLTAVLGAAADNIASGVLPGLEDYQKVGEGYFETVIRVANAVEVAKLALDGLGISMVDYTKVINKQGDVATEIIRDSVLAKEIATTARSTITVPNEPPRMKAAMVSAERFTSEWESYYDAIDNVNTAFEETFSTVEVVTTTLTGVGKIIQTFEGTAEELVQVYTALLGVRQSLADIGKAGTDFGIEMIKAAGGIEKLQDGLQSYYDNYLTDEERIAAMTGKLQKSFGDLGKEMPTSIKGFRELVEGQETVTAAGQETFAKLIILSDAFKALQDALANLDTEAKRIAEERKSLEEQLKTAQDAYNQATMTSEQLLKLQRDALDASNVSLFDQIQATKAATEAANKATSERKSLQDQLNDLTLSETEKLALQRSALEEVNRALFDQVQAAKAAKAAETELAETRKKQTDEIKSLQDQYDDLTMTEAEKVLKAREALLTDEAKAIFDKIQAYKAEQAAKDAAEQAAKDAAEQAAKAQEDAAKAAQDAADAAQKLKDAWLDVATSIMEEVKRIRGDLTTSPQQRLAQAQSAFSIAAAQAQAGDIEAAKSLPKLSQDLLKVAGDSAKTSLEFAQIQGSTLASLDRTLRYIASSQGVSVPAFAEGGTHTGGMRLVGERGAEMEVTGSSRIYSNQQLASMLNGGEEAAELREEVRQLREQMAALMELNNKYASVIATNSALMYKLLKKIAPDDAMITREATA